MLKKKLKTNNKTNTNAVWGHGNSVDQKKSANEPIANAVGVAPQGDPHFEEPTQNKNLISNLQPLTSNYKGITLIALIITIIVMLILVGVTISVALNGGLFKKANTAVTQTQKEVDRETLLSAVLASLNDNFEIPKLDALTSNLSNEWNAEGADGGPYTCTSPKGNKFTVDIKGNITEQSGEQSSETELNAWQKRGLNVPVKYDTAYYGTGGRLNQGLGIDSMTLILYSNGGFSISELDIDYDNARCR